MDVLEQMMKDAGGVTNSPNILATMQADAVSPVAQPTVQPEQSGLSNFTQAFGHHLMNLPHGIAQIVENTVNSGVQSIPTQPVDANNPNPSILDSLKSTIANTVASDNAGLQQREQQYQQQVPNTPTAYAGAALGEIAPFLANSVAVPLRAAGDAVGKIASSQVPNAISNITGRMASGATQGALVGLAQPTFNPDYWQGKQKQAEIGGAFGGSVPLLAKGAGIAYNELKDITQPLLNPQGAAAKILTASTGKDPQELANALRNYPQYVPGSTPTTAQIIATPEAVQLEKALRNNPEFTPTMENLSNANNTARLNLVNSIAGSPGDLEAAQAARQATAQNLYQQAFSETVPPTPWVKGQITQLMQRPAMQQAIKDAKKLALNEGTPLTNATSIQGLHYAKMSLDDQISNAIRTGDNNAARGLTQTKEQLLTVMNKLSPTYQDAMNTYASMSKPINTMEAGQQVQDVLLSKLPNTSNQPNITYTAYNNALSKALKNAKYGIDPEALNSLNNVKSDLYRQAISNGLKSPGSDTNYNTQAQGWLSRQLYGPQFTGSGASTKIAGTIAGAAAGSIFGHPMWGMGAGATAATGLSKIVGNKVSNAMLDIMTKPENAANALEKLTPSEASKLAQLLSMHPLTQQLIQSATNSP